MDKIKEKLNRVKIKWEELDPKTRLIIQLFAAFIGGFFIGAS